MSRQHDRAVDEVQLVAPAQPGIFPRVPGDQPASYPEQSPAGNAWTIYNYRERRCYWHFGRPAEWPEEVQRDYDPEVLDALRRRIAREETLIAEGTAALERDAATLPDRQARLRALWAPLAEYEGLPAGDPPLAGATQELALRLRAGRDQLARREQEQARLRGALQEAGATVV